MDDLGDVHVEAELNPRSIEEWLEVIQQGKKGTRRSDLATKVKKHLSALGWIFSYVYKRNNKRELRYKSPKGRWFYSLATACMSCLNGDSKTQQQIAPKSDLTCPPSNQVIPKSDLTCPSHQVIPKSDLTFPPSHQVIPKSDLTCSPSHQISSKSDLIPKQKTKRKRVADCYAVDVKAETPKHLSGHIEIVLNIDVSDEEQNKRRKTTTTDLSVPSEGKGEERPNIAVTDEEQNKRRKSTTDVSIPSEGKGEERPRIGKSLKNVLQVMQKKNAKGEKEHLRFWRKDCSADMNCDVCCVCHWGGDLLLCDGCPSAFHHTCLGLSSVPEEELWFCPCCCCDICGSIDSLGNSKLMSCEQCQRRFHLKCLKEEPCLVSSRGWFCSSQCDRVFTALQNLCGCKISVGGDLVWTLMRAPDDHERFDDEQMSKLDSAVQILHQGFEPTKDCNSGRDLVEELVYKRDSNGVGRGFYTVLIERKNVPVTVAAIRVEKDVVEIPLVATLPDYRRSGMCRVLMSELEKQMKQMGVFRLVLPAAAEVVTTWTERFGFKVMGSKERLEVVKHGMLDFVGTVMCHKNLVERQQVSGDSGLTD